MTTHVLGGGGCLGLQGTLYATDTLATMTTTPSKYQTIEMHGNPCSTTFFQGDIITDALLLKGTSDLNEPYSGSFLKVRQIALIQ